MSRKAAYFYVILFLSLYFTALIWRWNHTKSLPKGKNSSNRLTPQPTLKHRKVILFTSQWWQSHFPYLDEANRFCPRCKFTENQKLWKSSDAIIFHGRMLPKIIPKRKKPNELWVFMMFEALNKYEMGLLSTKIKRYDGLFNWTMTYRRDSDIFMPYGNFINSTKYIRPNFNHSWAYILGARGKKTYENEVYSVTPSIHGFKNRSLIAWIVSHCNSSNKREEIVKELKKHIPIDIYGDCGHNPKHKCKISKGKALMGVDCRVQISHHYKFYLSFESSNCEDYVTEKFFDVVAVTDMVPVVFGGSNYKAMFPNKSFINVKDFKSAKELGEYLKYLGNNPTKWLKYFEWRKRFWVQNNRFVSGYCSLCDKLWELEGKKNKKKRAMKDGENRTYHRISDWWLYKRNADKRTGYACEEKVYKWKKA